MRRVLWEWNVAGRSYEEKLEAAVAGGFDVLSISYRAWRDTVRDEIAGGELLPMARSRGIELDFLDGMSSWAPVAYPEDDASIKDALDFSPEQALELCAELKLKRIVAIGAFERDSISMSTLVASFGDFCDRAAEIGVTVDLEPIPLFGLGRLADAWEIVRRAERPNSSILIDTWHFIRSGSDFDTLRAIPRNLIVDVQVVDAVPPDPAAGLDENAPQTRVLPGQGHLPIDKVLEALREDHDLESIGPEAMSGLESFDATAVGILARDSVEALLASSEPSSRSRLRPERVDQVYGATSAP